MDFQSYHSRWSEGQEKVANVVMVVHAYSQCIFVLVYGTCTDLALQTWEVAVQSPPDSGFRFGLNRMSYMSKKGEDIVLPLACYVHRNL